MFFLNHFFHSLGFWQLVVAAIDFILFSFGFFYLHSVCLPSQWKNSIVSLVGMLFKMFDSCVCYVRIRLKVERCFFFACQAILQICTRNWHWEMYAREQQMKWKCYCCERTMKQTTQLRYKNNNNNFSHSP